MLDEVSQMFAIGKFPGAGHGKDIRIMELCDQPQRLVSGKARIGHDDNLAHPGWRHKGLQHLPKEDVLMPFDLRVHWGEGDWDAKTAPTHDQQDHCEPKHVGIMLTVARRMSQGMLPPPFVFQGAIPNEIEYAIRRRRERMQGGGRHLPYPRLRIPLARTDHTQGRPIFERGRQVGLESLEGALARIADQRHEQPAAHEEMLRLGAVNVSLERVEHLVYVAWDACATPHVSHSCGFWDVGCIQDTQERSYFQAFLGDTPTTEVCSPVTF